MACNYLEILRKWQIAHRMVGSTEAEWLIENVLLDSFAFLEAVPEAMDSLADIGSGAGIPGIPIAIVNPGVSVSLIESRRRRASFLAAVVRELCLARTHVIHSRAEDLGEEYAGSFDVAVMRCAGKTDAVLPVALPLVRAGGLVVVSGGPGFQEGRSGSGGVVVVQVGGRTRSFYRYTKN